MADEKSSTQSTAKLGLWLTFIAFLLIILVFRGKISEIQFGEKGVSRRGESCRILERPRRIELRTYAERRLRRLPGIQQRSPVCGRLSPDLGLELQLPDV